jgi:hypothetical protein
MYLLLSVAVYAGVIVRVTQSKKKKLLIYRKLNMVPKLFPLELKP